MSGGRQYRGTRRNRNQGVLKAREDADWRRAPGLVTRDCPDDAPDGTCWDCGTGEREPHRPDCRVYADG